ncbi:30S ribosomal protein S12 methylthiotransferase RimO [Candidatus Peregrinibacteria bacterium]|nr:30S ribosomal protein S12 methylthiotransferase RimO [Candidatus Peregrinibacteria bacterium]
MRKKQINVGVITLGCPKNIADTESLLAEFPENIRLTDVDKADIVLLNTCAFLGKARDEAYEKLAALKGRKVILTGCLTSLLKKDIFKKYPHLYAVVSGFHYPEISLILNEVADGKKIYAVSPEPAHYVDMPGKWLITPPSYAYVKIAEGCNNACRFCLIPKLKGKYRSRPEKSILDEIKSLIKLGVKEIILIAQDCGYYGADLYKKKKLAGLLKKITALKGDFWVRVLYVYPERLDKELLSVIKNSPKIAKYLDIPLQHGDPDILKAMRRPYDIARTLQVISRIREAIPDITLRTSLIVGFPGETDRHFKNLMTFLKTIHFDHVGVFEYSREKGTDAYSLKGQIPERVKKERRKKAMLLQQEISFRKNRALAGQTQRALIEQYDPDKKCYNGRTMRFAPEIDGVVCIRSEKPLALNQFHTVRITKADPYDLWGHAE